jgi:ATP-dependent Lon protease
LVEASVHSEYRTFSKNRGNENIDYAHVDSVNIFHLLDEILGQRKNNPLHTFDHYNEIERWLREQWAGLFRELLNRASSQKQLASLQAQVGELSEINQTLKTYLEEVVTKIVPGKSVELIKAESERLEEAQRKERVRKNFYVSYVSDVFEIPFEKVYDALVSAKSLDEFLRLISAGKAAESVPGIREMSEAIGPLNDLNEARELVGAAPFEKRLKTSKRAATE